MENQNAVSFRTELYVSTVLNRINEMERKIIGTPFSIENLSMSEIKEYIKYLQDIKSEYLELLSRIEKHLISGADKS